MSGSISFEQAIAYTENLFNQDLPPDPEFQQAIADLVSTDNGARGFFVYYLTNEIADRPTESVIQALRSVPIPSAELLVKNLVMSTAMAIAHKRNDDQAMALSSQRVRDRTANLIKLVNLSEVKTIADLMHESAESGVGEYANFLTKWGYDSEQRAAIASITSLKSSLS
jgi:hypothetical protein